jgi:hypothetical protein
LFEADFRKEFFIQGFHNRLLWRVLTDKSEPPISRIFHPVQMHGVIREIYGRYKYYFIRLGQKIATTALNLGIMLIIPFLAEPVKMTIYIHPHFDNNFVDKWTFSTIWGQRA